MTKPTARYYGPYSNKGNKGKDNEEPTARNVFALGWEGKDGEERK